MEGISYEDAIKIGVAQGIKYIKELEHDRITNRYDRRLRDTRLLLKNYRHMKAHYSLASNPLKIIEDTMMEDVLDNIDSIYDDEQYVQAIIRTKMRTKIILDHVEKVMKYYEAICKEDGESKERRFFIIKALYIEPSGEINPTYEQVAERFNINMKTVGRDVRLAVEELSILLFGIDGIKL